MIAHGRFKPRSFISLLFFGLLLSFLWCMVENIIANTQSTNAINISSVSKTDIILGILWLIGHGIHGASVFILPALYWHQLHPE